MRETQQFVVMHYGEVSIKGKNRPVFLRRLVRNVQQALGDLGDITVEMLSGRLLVAVPIEVSWAGLEERLRSIFGLANFALPGRHRTISRRSNRR
jgi:thiamine biosynthesis protein ThiI